MSEPRTPRVGDRVMYVPACEGDRCAHPTIFDRAATVTQVNDDGTLSLAVLHPGSLSHVHDVQRGGPGQLRTWYPRSTP